MPMQMKLFGLSARVSRLMGKEIFMKKVEAEMEEDELRPEYDLSQLKGRVRGKYAERYRAGTNLVLLEPDVAAVFPDAKAVNEALRLLIKVSQTRNP
jgi:hypothetical protein